MRWTKKKKNGNSKIQNEMRKIGGTKNERAAAAAFPAKEREKQQKMNERIVRRMAFIFGIVSRRQAQNGPNKAIVCVAHYFQCGFRSGTFRVYIFFYFSFRYLFASDYRPN